MNTQLMRSFSFLVAGAFLFTGCGALKQELADTTEQLESTESTLAKVRAELASCQDTVDGLSRDKEGLQSDLNERSDELAACQATVDELKETSSLQGAELEARLQELRKLREDSQRNARLYDDLVSKLRSMIDAGQLEVTNERGRLVINLPQDILFSSGSASLGREGITAISEVGKVLATIGDRRFQVEGHTDNVPISTSRFPSNWELSAARALAVVKLLIDSGVKETSLSGAGYGEFSPRVPNDSAKQREQNRRIEIVLVPDFDFGTTNSKSKKK